MEPLFDESEAVDVFLFLLGDDKMSDLIASIDAETIDERQSANLERIMTSLVDEGLLQGERKARKRPKGKEDKKDRAGPWKRFLRLKDVSVPSALEMLVAKSRTQGPKSFFDDKQFSCDEMTRRLLDSTSQQDPRSAQTLGDRFRATTRLTARQTRDPLIWCLQMLMFYDIGVAVAGRQVSYVGPAIQRRFREFIEALDGVDLNDIERWCVSWCRYFKIGRRLDIICSRLGPGCLFYLARYLSDDFLNSKFTSSGEAFEGAMLHLSTLQRDAKSDFHELDKAAADLRGILAAVYVGNAYRDHETGASIGVRDGVDMNGGTDQSLVLAITGTSQSESRTRTSLEAK